MRRCLTAFEKFVRTSEKRLSEVSTAMVVSLMVLGVLDVIGRYAFNAPIPGANEIGSMLMIGMICFVWSDTQFSNAHINVEILYEHYPRKTKVVVRMTGLILSTILFAVIVWQSLLQAAWHWEEGRTYQSVPISTVPVELFVPVGALLLCFRFVIQLMQLIPQLSNNTENDAF